MLTIAVSAQNVVPNPGFEDFSSCPVTFNVDNLLECEPWVVPTAGTADYFNACHVGGIVGVPLNLFGSQAANTGNAYVGGYGYHSGIPGYREYVQVQLAEPLVGGTSYSVSLYYSVASLTCPIDQLGIYISTSAITDMSSQPLPVVPQVTLTSGIVPDYDWHLLTGCFIALGGEEYITIGNFASDGETNFDSGCPPFFGAIASYMYIDDVSIEEGPPGGEILFSLPDDLTICESYEIVAPVPNASYIWSDGSNEETLTVTESGVYHLTITTGCDLGTDSIEVEVLYEPDPIDLGEPEVILCPGEEIEYDFDPLLGDYTWQDNSSSASYTISTSGIYSLTLSTPCGDVEDQITVVSLDPPEPIDLGADITLCPTEELALTFDPTLGDFVWQDGSTNPNFTVIEPGTYAVTISNYCGDVSDEIVIDYYPEPFVVFNFDTISLCEGETTLLVLDPLIGEYFWSDGTSGHELLVTEPGVYSVTVVNPCGSDNTSIVIDYDFEPVVDLGDDITICPAQLPYTIDLTGLADVEHFVWDDGTMEPTFSITEEGSFGVTVSNDCFEVWDFIAVTIEDAEPVISLPQDTVLCPGETLILDVANIPGTFQWQDNNTSGIYEVFQSGIYSVTVTNACGEGSDLMEVLYDDVLPALNLGPDLSLCPGQEVVLQAGVTGVQYFWNDSSTLETLTVNQADTVTLTISNACNSSTDTIMVSVNSAAPDAGLPNQVNVCDGESVTISTTVGGATYQWNTGSTEGSISVTTPGEYILTVTNSCGIDVDTTTVIGLGASPVFDLGPDQSICPGESVILNPGISGTYEWHDGNVTTTYETTVPGEISLTVTNVCGQLSDTIEVSFLQPIPLLDLGADMSICPGETVLINPGISNVDYTWSDGSTGVSYTATTGEVIFLDISNACGFTTDTVVITLLAEVPILDLGADFSICPGDAVTLNPGINDVTYQWQDGSSNTTYTVDQSGEIILSIENACGVATDTVKVSVSTTGPVLDLGPDISVCEGETVLINPAINGVMYQWQDGSTGSSLAVNVSTTIVLEISNSCGSAADTMLVEIDGVAPVVDLGMDILLCDGEGQTLSVNNDDVTIEWQDGSSNADFFVTEAGWYHVMLTNLCGTAADSVLITTALSPAPFALGDDQIICTGTVVTLNAPAINPGEAIQWSTGSSATSIDVSASGDFELVISTVCGETSDDIIITVDDNEIIEVGDELYKFCDGDQFLFDVQQPFDASYLWSTGSTDAELSISAIGIYVVTITSACDEHIDEFIVEPDQCVNPNIFIPNIFSPNNDNINDVFRIEIDERDIVGFQVWIYDRWGGVVFNSLSADFEWRGDVDGKPLNPDVFVYHLLIDRQLGGRIVPEILKGDVTLIR